MDYCRKRGCGVKWDVGKKMVRDIMIIRVDGSTEHKVGQT